MTELIRCYLPLVTWTTSLSTGLWRFSDKVLFIFTFYLIIAYFTQLSPFSSYYVTSISRPYSNSSVDLISVQLSSPIIPPHQNRVHFLPDSIFIDYSVTPHQDTLYQINYGHPPSSVPFFFIPPPPTHTHTCSRSYSSSSVSLYNLISCKRYSTASITVY